MISNVSNISNISNILNISYIEDYNKSNNLSYFIIIVPTSVFLCFVYFYINIYKRSKIEFYIFPENIHIAPDSNNLRLSRFTPSESNEWVPY